MRGRQEKQLGLTASESEMDAVFSFSHYWALPVRQQARSVSGSPTLVFLLKESAGSGAGTAALRHPDSVAGQRVAVESSQWDRET